MDRTKPPRGYTLELTGQDYDDQFFCVFAPDGTWLDGLDCSWDEAVERAWDDYDEGPRRSWGDL